MIRKSLIFFAAFAILMCSGPVWALAAGPLPREHIASLHEYRRTLKVLAKAVRDNKMALVNRASATRGAKSIGETIPGNAVFGVFAPGYAVRMLKASVAAGFEAPIRIYVTEDDGGKVTVSYVKPTVVFAPYGNAELDKMAQELDPIFAKIVAVVTQPLPKEIKRRPQGNPQERRRRRNRPK